VKPSILIESLDTDWLRGIEIYSTVDTGFL